MGLLIAITSGWIIGRLKLERWLQDWVLELKSGTLAIDIEKFTFEDRIREGTTAVKDIVVKIWPYILGGIAIGALVHGYLSTDYIASILDKSTWYSVPLAVLAGIPLYTCSPGAVPIVFALIEKGVPLGTALAFMMAVIGISLPEIIILKKVLKLPFILTFISIIATGIMVVGYILNLLF